MEFFLHLIATRAFGGVIGVLGILFGFQRSSVSISPLAIFVSSDSLTVNAILDNGFTKELDEVILSGTPVIFCFTLSVLTHDGGVVVQNELLHTVKYDIIEKEFIITRTGRSPVITNVVDEIKQVMNEVYIRVLPSIAIQQDKKYKVKLRASLSPIEIGKLGKLDLMILWKNETPRTASEWISGAKLISNYK